MNPFDLPVHPLLVHFPLAMLTASWVCLLCRYGLRSEVWGERARLLEVVGVATLPLTIVAGFVDTRGFDFLTDARWDRPLVWHALVSVAAAAVFTAHWWWKRTARPVSTRSAVTDLGWATLGLWALVLTVAPQRRGRRARHPLGRLHHRGDLHHAADPTGRHLRALLQAPREAGSRDQPRRAGGARRRRARPHRRDRAAGPQHQPRRRGLRASGDHQHLASPPIPSLRGRADRRGRGLVRRGATEAPAGGAR